MPFVPTFSHRAFGEEDRMRVAAEATLPWTESIGDTAATVFDGATASLNRWGNEEAFVANDPETGTVQRMFSGFNAMITGNNPFLDYYKNPERMSAQDAQANYSFPDPFTNKPALTFNESVYPAVAEQMAERKKRELSRAWLTANSENTIVSNTAHFGTSLAAGFLDPLQLASAMIPVGWFGRLGVLKNLAKTNPLMATIGAQAMQGAAGAALLEPIIYSRAYREQADYSLIDSGINILFGGAMGAFFPALEAGGRKVISLGIADPNLKAKILEGGIYREANAFHTTVSDPAPLPITDKRTFLDTSTIEAVYRAASAREAEGMSLSPTEHNAILNLDTGKIRADLEAGRELTFDEYTAAVERQSIAEQMASRFSDEQLAGAASLINDNAMQAAHKSALDTFNRIKFADIPEKARVEALQTVAKFVDDLNAHAGYQAFTPPVLPKENQTKLNKLSGLSSADKSVDAILADMHPAVASVTDGLEAFRAMNDLKAEKLGRSIPETEVKAEAARRLKAFQDKVNSGDLLPGSVTGIPAAPPKHAAAYDRGDIPAATSALKEEVAALEAEIAGLDASLKPDTAATEHIESLQNALRELQKCAVGI